MIVLDNSVYIAALFSDEKQHEALALRSAIEAGEVEAFVPAIFRYEAMNTLVQSLRRKRIKQAAYREYLADLEKFPVQVDELFLFQQVGKLAVKHTLSIYDAAYLELALRESLVLVTLDKALAAAARKERVPLLIS